jgi:hypothetical protein
MVLRSIIATALVFGKTQSCVAQEDSTSKPTELEILRECIGVWDARGHCLQTP